MMLSANYTEKRELRTTCTSKSIMVYCDRNFDYDQYYHSTQCIICKSKTRMYSLFHCIHRPNYKDRSIYSYIGKKYYIKIFSCNEHYSTVKHKMKDRVLVCESISDFYNECLQLYEN